MSIIIYPYKNSSMGAKALKDWFNHNSGHKTYRVDDTVNGVGMFTNLINWGCSNPNRIVVSKDDKSLVSVKYPGKGVGFNKPICVDIACCKISTFNMLRMDQVSVPRFWVSPYDIDAPKTLSDLLGKGALLVGRTLIRSSAGKGIVMFKAGDPIPQGVKLITEFIQDTIEYRVHVVRGKVIDIREKRTKDNFDGEINHQVRSYKNGWIFCMQDVHPNPAVYSEAVDAVAALRLDFGAVDIVWSNQTERAYVLEINTAPGLQGSTVERYGAALLEHM